MDYRARWHRRRRSAPSTAPDDACSDAASACNTFSDTESRISRAVGPSPTPDPGDAYGAYGSLWRERELTMDASTPAHTAGPDTPGASTFPDEDEYVGLDAEDGARGHTAWARDEDTEKLRRLKDWHSGVVGNRARTAIQGDKETEDEGEVKYGEELEGEELQGRAPAEHAPAPPGNDESGPPDDPDDVVEGDSFESSRSGATARPPHAEKGKGRALDPDPQPESPEEGGPTQNGEPRVFYADGTEYHSATAPHDERRGRWVEGATTVVSEWAEEHGSVHRLVDECVSVDNYMATGFIHGFLNMLASRDRPAYRDGPTDAPQQHAEPILERFVDIKRMSMAYLHEHFGIRETQAEDNVSIFLVMLADNFFEAHMYLLDTICEKALANREKRRGDVLEIRDFAFGAEMFFDYFPPGSSQTFTRVHDTLEGYRLRLPRAAPVAQTTQTRSGRESKHTKQHLANLQEQNERAHQRRLQQLKKADAGSAKAKAKGQAAGPATHCATCTCGQSAPASEHAPEDGLLSTWYVSRKWPLAVDPRQIPAGIPRQDFRLVCAAPPSASQVAAMVDAVSREFAGPAQPAPAAAGPRDAPASQGGPQRPSHPGAGHPAPAADHPGPPGGPATAGRAERLTITIPPQRARRGSARSDAMDTSPPHAHPARTPPPPLPYQIPATKYRWPPLLPDPVPWAEYPAQPPPQAGPSRVSEPAPAPVLPFAGVGDSDSEFDGGMGRGDARAPAGASAHNKNKKRKMERR